MFFRTFKKSFTRYFVLFGVILSLLSGIIGYIIHIQSLQNEIASKADEVMKTTKNLILKPTIQRVDNTVTTLANNKIVRECLHECSTKHKEELENIFLTLAYADNQIMHIRLIDANGQERVRVDRDTEKTLPFIVEHHKLQDKSYRDYFQILSHMKSETLWHSNFDLKNEHGKLEIPYRPTIRVAMPLLENGRFLGTIIINLQAKNLIDALSNSSDFEYYMIDKDGYYIYHDDNRYSFNRYTHIVRNVVDDFEANPYTQMKKILYDDLYIYPFDDIVQNDDKIMLILKPREDYKDALISSKIDATFITLVLSIALSFLLSHYLSRHPEKIHQRLMKTNQELEELSSMDDMTGIYNRRKLDEFMKHEIAIAHRYERPISFIILDIDHFKHVNDTFGHQAGDMVLAHLAEIISQTIRESDIFGRYGGEEFVIICPETPKEEAYLLSEKVRSCVENHPFEEVGQKTISLGVAQLEKDDSVESIFRKADTALYQAKNGGRNRTMVYNLSDMTCSLANHSN